MLAKIYSRFKTSGNLHSLLGNVFFAIAGMISFLVLVRILNKEDFGAWVFFITMASLLDMFRLGLTGTAAIRLISVSNQHEKFISASYQLSFAATLAIIGVLWAAWFFVPSHDAIYQPVLQYYPLLALANLPFNQALVLAQGKVDFKRLMFVRIMNGAFTLGGIMLCYFAFTPALENIIIFYIIANAGVSLITVAAGWDGIKHIRSADKEIRKEILKFGKYSTAGYIGSNLLRSSDTLILGLAPFLGPKAIAIYAIPLKFVEAVEVPLRSFAATAFPRLSKALKDDRKSFGKMLMGYSLYSTLLVLPMVAFLVAFPGFALHLLGGDSYSAYFAEQRTILLITCAYMLLLPLDRYSGVALFALDKPKQNFYKILVMLVANIVFDLVAVFVFQSLIYVALATLLFTIAGIIIGWQMLMNQSTLKFHSVAGITLQTIKPAQWS